VKHLYIHVPFCPRRCIYCDFSIAVRREIPADLYVNSIVREYEQRRTVGDWNDAPLETLYLGGGTPSLVPAASLASLIHTLLDAERVSDGPAEVTIEANPEDVSESNARAWADAGVNRVSLGIQSFDPDVLRWLHRTHSPDQAAAATRVLREAGIESISLDFLAALPPRLEHDFASDLAHAIELEPDHISVYGLTVEPNTSLAKWIERDAVTPASEEKYARDFLHAHDALAEAGYEHYEVSNYAIAGKRSRHNCAYWDGSVYAGLGPSAHGYDGRERRWNVRPWARYETLVTATGDATEGREVLSPAEVSLERVYLGLRTSEGLSLAETGRFDAALLSEIEENGLAEKVGRRWRLTASGWLRLDEIAAALTTSAEGG
jgi:oxygen-independent coproporphyrinogen-3 oxidase